MTSTSRSLILGAGMTGLSAGIRTGWPIYEARQAPGGICSSYYMEPGGSKRLPRPVGAEDRYRFEYGGGHWIFGGDEDVLAFIEQYAPCERYRRRSSVYLPESGCRIPYPLQYHLAHAPASVRASALEELNQESERTVRTMEDWVQAQFGSTLNRFFFAPFHEAYTAGLWTRIRQQDNYKTPVDRDLVLRGAIDKTPDAGYNATFVYPREGLDRLALGMAAACDVRYGKRVVRIDTNTRRVYFDDESHQPYERIYATLPLNEMMRMTGLEVGEKADPHTSVLVLNIGAVKGSKCPDDHWIYVPKSRAGFHRVGFYSNVDAHFLPAGAADRVSLYVERAFLPENRPSPHDVDRYGQAVVKELQEWGFIEATEVIDPTWIEVAYTWSWPDSTWREKSIERLAEHGITMLGRYGRWRFQGISASIREGMEIN